ncbi:Hsp20/alpha crystallin family protein [Teladorsagia circumcincta]|uniref:Hsp20/alpha crystallin family protein n=1 Tax=Teladorsagia circumcincta TaxID=45464 RepID=A0A2G9UNQ6_TELCI|nr:Hsp20/alpha crystallin family protein [Teladorsagia circumcincta]
MSIPIHPWARETTIRPRFLNNIFSEFDDAFNDLAPTKRPVIHPIKRTDEVQALDGQLGKVTDDGSKLAITLDVSKFKPDELKVSIDGQILTIEGKHEITEGPNYSSRSFVRRWTLPEDVDVEQIRSNLTENGQLAIEVPKNKPAIAARTIPIQKAVNQQ